MDEVETVRRFDARVAAPDDVATLVALERLRGAIGTEVANRRRSRRRHHGVAFAVSSAAAVALAVAVLLPSGARARTPATRKHTTILEVSSYHFTLPSGFTTTDAACTAPTPPGLQDGNGVVHRVGANPETVLQSMQTAASADGGCVGVALAAGDDVVPAGAMGIGVGSYQGYLVTAPSGDLTLYVAIPVAIGDHYLILASVGLTQQQLVAIAASGLPSADGNQTVIQPRP